MIFRTVATSAALAIGLAVVGAVAGPQWDPEPIAEHIVPATADTTIGGQPAGGAAPVGTYPVHETIVTIPLDGATVEGTLRIPEGVTVPAPAMVFVHGAGTAGVDAFSDLAEAVTSAGVVTLVPAKRMDTYSTRHRDYETMAGDYQRSVDLLRGRPEVDPDAVGLYGESEGTWIVPIMAVKDPRIAFTALVSAPVVPPREQAAFAVDSYLRNTDVPHGVFRAIPRAVGMAIPGGGFEYADFDVKPWLAQLDCPVLVVFGTADPSMPVEQGVDEIIEETAKGGNRAVTARYYEGANHGIKIEGVLVPDFLRDLSAWVTSLPTSATAAPQIAGDTPNQQYLAAPVPSPRWLGNGDLLVGLLIVGAVLLIIGPVLWAGASGWNRIRGRGWSVGSIARRLRWPLVGLALGSIGTAIALIVYLVAVARLALDYEKDAWVVQGGWVAVRLIGLATVVAGALILNRRGEIRAMRKAATSRLDVPSETAALAPTVVSGWAPTVTWWSALTGSTILLVILAYWGVYQLGI